MKIALTATGPTLDAELDQRFGRCPCFVVVDDGAASVEVVDNTCRELGSGAGIQAARIIVDHGISVVLTGRVGPHAAGALDGAGIRVIAGCRGTVQAVLDEYRSGRAQQIADPPDSDHPEGTPIDSPERRPGDPRGSGRRGAGRRRCRELATGSGGERGGGWRLRGVPGI
jgi:predicted Fe-Mo cluster-binding NifX family protein